MIEATRKRCDVQGARKSPRLTEMSVRLDIGCLVQPDPLGDGSELFAFAVVAFL